MTLNNEAKLIRRSVERITTGARPKYSPALRRRILSWVRRAKKAGMLEAHCSVTLGVPVQRFEMWRIAEQSDEPASSKAMVPFELPLELAVEPVSKDLVPIEVSPSIMVTPGLAFVGPRGFRIEGLTLEQAFALLREFE